jgi:Flp pilus assembly protein TadB
MERPNQKDIVVALAEVRPAPRSEFAAELDRWAAAGFPLAPKRRRSPLAALAKRLEGLAPQRLALASAASALVAIAVATVVIAGNSPNSRPVALDAAPSMPRHQVQFSESVSRASSAATGSSATAGSKGAPEIRAFSREIPQQEGESQTSLPDLNGLGGNAAYTPAARSKHRDIERSAEIGLLAAPDDVADDSAQVFSAVHDADGIVLRSTTTAGRHAGASFDLLIPSARLGDALAAFSAIDEVGSRHDATADITAPTATVTERLRDSRAKIDGLLGRLSAAQTETESEAIESELREERRHAVHLRSQLDRLNRRTEFSPVALKIETGSAKTGSGGAWGIDDAFGDAGHVLGIAAGVTLVGLAVLAPIALLFLLAWLAQRLWLRSRRERALDA